METESAASDHRFAWWIWGMLVFFIPFQLHYDYMLNQFYHFGAPYNDAGILARVAWRGDLWLTPPLVFTNYSFMGVHFTPLFSLLCAFSWFIPTHVAEYYSAFVATTYAGLGLTLFYAFKTFIRPQNPWKIAGAAMLSIAFAFNDVIMDGIWIGHFEYAIPLAVLLFCFHYVQKNWLLCFVFFALTLSMREDAGLHLIAVMGLIGCVRYYKERSFKAVRLEAAIIACAFIYCVLAMWASLAARGYWGSTFETVYSGKPAYAHLSFHLLLERAGRIFKDHVYLWLGFLITAVQAARTRNPYLIIGFAAYIPWFLLSWTAVDGNPATLQAYYAFPFVISLAWPILGVGLFRGFPLSRTAAREAMVLQTLLVLAGLVMWDSDNHLEFGPVWGARWGAYTLQQGTENRQLLQDFAMRFDAGEGDLGSVMSDINALSLIRGDYKGSEMTRVEMQDKTADTLIYMHVENQEMPQNILDQAHKNKLDRHYCIKGTTFCLFTNRTPDKLGTFNALFSEAPPPH